MTDRNTSALSALWRGAGDGPGSSGRPVFPRGIEQANVTVNLIITPIGLDEANAFVEIHHRHHDPVPGCKFCVAVSDEANKVRGVAIIGRPVARGSGDT